MYLITQPPGRIAGGQIWFRGLNLLAGSEEDVRVRPRPKGPPKLIPSDSHLKKHRARMNKVRGRDRKSTRLNSSHRCISYAVFCLKKKKNESKYTGTLVTEPITDL